jgi:hypothetical protein
MSIDKQLDGDLKAAGKGEMPTAMTDVKGSAGTWRLNGSVESYMAEAEISCCSTMAP